MKRSLYIDNEYSILLYVMVTSVAKYLTYLYMYIHMRVTVSKMILIND